MSDSVIRIENISKLFRLGEIGTGTLSHDLNRWWARIRGRDDPYALVGQENDRTSKRTTDYVWALKNINLDIKEGDVVGFIGSNGAGKSTLLKLISRITTPTDGTIKLRGRLASLLEVGTGMHSQMTARENIYLNGAILGMKRREISKKLDDIIEFAGCSLYVDTPIKRFSSGMRVRLGFAVAAYLQSDLLIVDEVLAVGDAEFQQRAVGKMGDLSRESGRTVLFVSHNMATVQQLCTRGIVLNNGEITFNGATDDAIQKYTTSIVSSFHDDFDYSRPRYGNGDIRASRVLIRNADYDMNYFPVGAGLKFIIQYEARKNFDQLRAVIDVMDMSTTGITRLDTSLSGNKLSIEKGQGKIICETEALNIKPGKYYINIVIRSGGILQDQLSRVCMFVISPSNYYGSGKLLEANAPVKVLIRHEWSREKM